MPVGIIANNGVLFSQSALKGAHFVELCNQRKACRWCSCRTSAASWSGREYETGGIAQATARSSSPPSPLLNVVPKFTDRHRRLASEPVTTACVVAPTTPRFLWMWPNARISRHGW